MIFAAYDSAFRFLGIVQESNDTAAVAAAIEEFPDADSIRVRPVLNVFTTDEDFSQYPSEAFADPDCTYVFVDEWQKRGC